MLFQSSDARNDRTVAFHVKSLEAESVARSWPVMMAGRKETKVLKNPRRPEYDNEQLNRALQELAWKIVIDYPPSGVKAPTQTKQ